jgi:hypothetical protein
MSEIFDDVSNDALLGRAVRNVKPRHVSQPEPRWVCVMHLFGLGSTYSKSLCRAFGTDPDEVLKLKRRSAQ